MLLKPIMQITNLKRLHNCITSFVVLTRKAPILHTVFLPRKDIIRK